MNFSGEVGFNLPHINKRPGILKDLVHMEGYLQGRTKKYEGIQKIGGFLKLLFYNTIIPFRILAPNTVYNIPVIIPKRVQV